MKDPALPWELALHSGMPSHRNVSKSQFDPVSSACSHSRILSAASQGLRRRDITPTFSMDSLPTNQGQTPTSHSYCQDIFTPQLARGGRQPRVLSLSREAKGARVQIVPGLGSPTSHHPLLQASATFPWNPLIVSLGANCGEGPPTPEETLPK